MRIQPIWFQTSLISIHFGRWFETGSKWIASSRAFANRDIRLGGVVIGVGATALGARQACSNPRAGTVERFGE